MKLIPLIKQLIKEANETASAADGKVSSAEGDAEMSFNTATGAHNTTLNAKNVSHYIMKVDSSRHNYITLWYGLFWAILSKYELSL